MAENSRELKVSLIITAYNNPWALKKVLDSLLRQNEQPDEVLIADDGSGKEVEDIVHGFSLAADFPVVHIWQEHKGFRAARIRNEAIKKSQSDYIILLDGDCVINRHFIEDHIKMSEKGYFVQGKRVHVTKKGGLFFDVYNANSFFELFKMAVSGRISNIHHIVRLPGLFVVKNRKLAGIKSCNMSFFRKDIMAVNGFNEDFVGWGNEDSELVCRMFKYGLIKKVSPFAAICFHLWHPTNKAETNGNRHLLKATIESWEYFCKNGIYKQD